MVSSRSGLVDNSATGQPISSSTRRTYLIASAGSSAQLRAPSVESDQPGMGLRQSDTELKDKFDAVIGEMKCDGSLNELIEKWEVASTFDDC